jgi:hypothetical protein
MKSIKVLLIVVFLFFMGSSFQQVIAQEKAKEDKEQEMKIQQAIDQEKKAMAQQKQEFDRQAKKLQEVMQETSRIATRARDSAMNLYKFRIHSSGNALQRFDEPFYGSTGEPFSGYLGRRGDSERTTWDFSKSVKENTFSRDYTFDVEKMVNTVIMSVMGDCKTGNIRIKIVMPSGKSYSDILIDESGNLNWRKSFTISEEENKDKVGEWKFRIETEKATGFFKISLQTY